MREYYQETDVHFSFTLYCSLHFFASCSITSFAVSLSLSPLFLWGVSLGSEELLLTCSQVGSMRCGGTNLGSCKNRPFYKDVIKDFNKAAT